MSEAEQIDGLTEEETQFFESGGEAEIESAEQVEGDVQPQEESAQEDLTQEEQQEIVPQQPEKPPEGYVPHGALHKERMMRKELQQRLDSMENRFQQVISKLDEQNQEPPPDFEDSPLDAIKHQIDGIQQQFEKQNENLTLQQQQQQAQEYQKQLVNHYQNDAARFQESHPDFMDAYQYMYNSRVNELQAYGYPEEQIANIMQQEELSLVYQATQNEMSPAQVVYAAAKARGYTQKQQEQSKTQDEVKFDMASKGQEASRSLSNSGGKTEKEISLEALAEMDDDEFEKNWDKLIGG
jgi:hypothetical protein